MGARLVFRWYDEDESVVGVLADPGLLQGSMLEGAMDSRVIQRSRKLTSSALMWMPLSVSLHLS